MTRDELKALKALAVVATRHPWFTMEAAAGRKDVVCSGREGTIALNLRSVDADFIAAFNPLKAIDLLTYIQTLQQEVHKLTPKVLDI